MADGHVFRVEETHGRVLRTGNEIISQSTDIGWRSLYAAKFREAPLSVSEPAIGHPSLIYHIARLIGVHLARAHSSRARAPRNDEALDGLSRARVRRLLDYIEQHLGEDLSLEALAGEVSLSPLYLVRAFRSAVGQSPHQYVVG